MKINELNEDDSYTEYFTKHQEILPTMSIAQLVKAYDYINLLATLVEADNEVLDDLPEITEPLLTVINSLSVGENCPHCTGTLYMSDLPQYNSVCPNCNENF